MTTRLIICAFLAVGLSACGIVYKQDVQQGNVLDEDDVSQLDIGMTKRQVMVLLGSPSVQSPFHENRWDYVNTYSRRGGTPRKRTLTLRFEDNRLASVEGSYLDQDSVAAQALRELQRPDDQPIQDLESVLDERL
jgi:outer membrane protein assembly factor BamE